MVDLFLITVKKLAIAISRVFFSGRSSLNPHNPHHHVIGRNMILDNLVQQIGLNPKKVALTEGGEYHSACPSCRGKDRFIIWPNARATKCYGRYWCRQCDKKGDTIQFCIDFLGQDYRKALETAQANTSQDLSFLQDQKLIVIDTHKILEMPSEKWLKQAHQLVDEAHDDLLLRQDILMKLEQRGLPITAVKQYKIGYIEKDMYFQGIEKSIWIPQGILIPTIDINQVVRLKVRRDNWSSNDTLPKYFAVSGGMKGFNIIGDRHHSIIIVVESELDAYAIHYTLADIACVIAIGGASKNPDIVTDHLVQCRTVLVCHDNDDTGFSMLLKWKERYPHAQGYPTPFGKDIGEAVKQGLKVRPWILQYRWQGHKGQKLVDSALQDISGRKELFYTALEKEICLGPDSLRAKTGELQEGLRLIERSFKESKLFQ